MILMITIVIIAITVIIIINGIFVIMLTVITVIIIIIVIIINVNIGRMNEWISTYDMTKLTSIPGIQNSASLHTQPMTPWVRLRLLSNNCQYCYCDYICNSTIIRKEKDHFTHYVLTQENGREDVISAQNESYKNRHALRTLHSGCSTTRSTT